MTGRYAELLMYTAPQEISEANERWLAGILERLQVSRSRPASLELMPLFLSPQLLLTQTCGYPLMTALRGRVRVIGRPCYTLPDSADGSHCSLLLARNDQPRQGLSDFHGSRGVINNEDSNTGMNLLRHTVAPLQRQGRFFSALSLSGSHRESLRWLREGLADLAAVDSVTYAYLARHASAEVAGLRVVTRSAWSPCLPYIGAASLDAGQAETIRRAMNLALQALPHVAATLGLREVLPATEDNYRIVLDYQRQAQEAGLPSLR
ncbi:phosphate/phosphite/phosphonate ABC transporter substrate-binding protein [Pseudomonas akapageensis]|uniref:phosphate/phosphite/phosphonate ABC transporter substrate-binding protein n=1 Tax=Pseudomonas akapageensis TaxID=2609961 RepID=UPI00140D1D3D|nr:PhnD/SsuA/transferrin family substrate-binding protein [Pseudomonas akapageensis]